MLFSKYLTEGVVITYDFDDTLQFNGDERTLPRKKYIKEFADHLNNGNTVHVVTSRVRGNDVDIHELLDTKFDFLNDKSLNQIAKDNEKQIDVYTTGGLKADTLADIGSYKHYDDDKRELDAAKKKGILTQSAFDSDLSLLYQQEYNPDKDPEYEVTE